MIKTFGGVAVDVGCEFTVVCGGLIWDWRGHTR